MKIVTIAILCIISTYIHAGGASGKGEIDYIYQRSVDGHLAVYKKDGNWANPDNCGSSERMVLTRDNPSRNEFYSALLASKISGRDINAWLVGCVDWNGTTYPEISGLYTY